MASQLVALFLAFERVIRSGVESTVSGKVSQLVEPSSVSQRARMLVVVSLAYVKAVPLVAETAVSPMVSLKVSTSVGGIWGYSQVSLSA